MLHKICQLYCGCYYDLRYRKQAWPRQLYLYRYPPIDGTVNTLEALAEESLTHVDIC